MKLKTLVFMLVLSGAGVAMTFETASAFCGVIEETKSGLTAEKALRKANNALKIKLAALKSEHGSKLVLDTAQNACVGGAISINSKGKQIVGHPSCTVTQPFCVNP